MPYDISDHVLLSAEALALGEPVLTEWSNIAEYALGLRGITFTEYQDVQAVENAIVLTVNASVRLSKEDPAMLRKVGSESKGSQSVSLVDVQGRHVVIPQLALDIVSALLGPPPHPSHSEIVVTW